MTFIRALQVIRDHHLAVINTTVTPSQLSNAQVSLWIKKTNKRKTRARVSVPAKIQSERCSASQEEFNTKVEFKANKKDQTYLCAIK